MTLKEEGKASPWALYYNFITRYTKQTFEVMSLNYWFIIQFVKNALCVPHPQKDKGQIPYMMT